MIKKIVIGGAAAALLVAGAASAAQLTGVSDTTLAGSQVTVSGAELEGVEFGHTYIGGGQGNGEKTAVISTVTLDLDKAGVDVQGRLLENVPRGNDYVKNVDGQKKGYLAITETDADGKVTFDITDQKIEVEAVDAIDIIVTS
ncbi:MAG: hypothetical protein WCA82_11445 [Jiangellales bacterium]